jgi:endo-1,4-beta-xylanase
MIRSIGILFFLLGLALTGSAGASTGDGSVPPGGAPLLAGDSAETFAATGGQDNGDAITLAVVESAGPGFANAMRIETSRDLSPAWAVEARTPLTRAVQKGDTGFLRFHARTIASADETGAGQVRVVVQQAGSEYTKSLETTVTMRAGWQEFLLPFTFADDYAPGAAELSFGFGFKRETIEIGGIELLNFGRSREPAALPRTRFSYAGREADAAWRQQALARIEQIRKSDFLIEVRDAAGQPAAGATIRVEQIRSAFQFGSALQFTRLVKDTPENLAYREKALALFNAASPENDLKWGPWDGERGPDYNRPQSLQALRWLREHGFYVRGHVLVWPGWKNLPESIRKLNGTEKQSEIPALTLKHIADITGATREFVQEWDVLNEPYDNHDLMGLFGADIMVDWFKAAQAGAPGAPLYLNDYSNHDLVTDKMHCADFFRVAKFLQAKGAPLGGLGLQGHISAQPSPPEHVLAALEAYAELKLPIRITEFDVDTEDEQLQADYTRDFLVLAYSHPSVVGVQLWGFWEKAHWRPHAALFRADWSEKPAAKVYQSLVLHYWRTKLKGTVGAAGKVGGRGFHGDYVVTVERDGKRAEQTLTLRPDEPKTVVTVTLP